jgi:hypothetical protein
MTTGKFTLPPIMTMEEVSTLLTERVTLLRSNMRKLVERIDQTKYQEEKRQQSEILSAASILCQISQDTTF